MTDQRGRGRPRLPPELRQKSRSCKLEAVLDDGLCKLSAKTGISINALIKVAVGRLLQDSHLILGSQNNINPKI